MAAPAITVNKLIERMVYNNLRFINYTFNKSIGGYSSTKLRKNFRGAKVQKLWNLPDFSVILRPQKLRHKVLGQANKFGNCLNGQIVFFIQDNTQSSLLRT